MYNLEGWVNTWVNCKQSVLNTMVRNLVSDLEAGYNFFGKSIQGQIKQINQYKQDMEDQKEVLLTMDPKLANFWCYRDLKQKGMIYD